MKADSKTLDDINNERKVNETISRDEEELNLSNKTVPLAETEDLIRQLPKDHVGRNNWLSQYGTSDEAESLRTNRNNPASLA